MKDAKLVLLAVGAMTGLALSGANRDAWALWTFANGYSSGQYTCHEPALKGPSMTETPVLRHYSSAGLTDEDFGLECGNLYATGSRLDVVNKAYWHNAKANGWPYFGISTKHGAASGESGLKLPDTTEFTYECFVKIEDISRGVCIGAITTDNYTYNLAVTPAGELQLQSYGAEGVWKSVALPKNGLGQLCLQGYRHYAMVFRDGGIDVYFDYALVYRATAGIITNVTKFNHVLLFANYNDNNYGAADAKVAALRVTAAALESKDFLVASAWDGTEPAASAGETAWSFFWPFRDGAPGTVPAAVAPQNGDAVPHFAGTVRAAGGASEIPGCAFSDDAPGKYVFASHARDKVLCQNPQSLEFSASGTSGAALELDNLARALAKTSGDGFTLEFWFKSAKSNLALGFFDTGLRRLKAYYEMSQPYGIWTLKKFVQDIRDGSSPSGLAEPEDTLADGRWHHAAIVWDKANSTAAFHVDYRKAGELTGTGCAFNGDTRLRIGAEHWLQTSGLFSETKISSLRATARKLAANEFMMAADDADAAENTTFVHFSFNDGAAGTKACLVKPDAAGGYYAYPALKSTRNNSYTGDGAKFSADRKSGKYVFRDRSRQRVLGENTGSLDLTPTYVNNANATVNDTFSLRMDPAAEMRDAYFPENFTVEFFVKVNELNTVNGNALVAMGGDYNCIGWQFYLDAQGKPQFKYTHVKGANDWTNHLKDIDPGIGSINDGNWHHLAFSCDRTNKKLIFWLDYRKMSERSVTDVPYRPQSADGYKYKLGEGYGSYDPKPKTFNGWVDEFRISGKVLTEMEFIRTANDAGMVIVVR